MITKLKPQYQLHWSPKIIMEKIKRTPTVPTSFKTNFKHISSTTLKISRIVLRNESRIGRI